MTQNEKQPELLPKTRRIKYAVLSDRCPVCRDNLIHNHTGIECGKMGCAYSIGGEPFKEAIVTNQQNDYDEFHACRTGDCPHELQTECDIELAKKPNLLAEFIIMAYHNHMKSENEKKILSASCPTIELLLGKIYDEALKRFGEFALTNKMMGFYE